MKVQMAYCSACDREVEIAFPDQPGVTDGHANILDSEVVCLEIGSKCTGAMCPVGATPPAVMAVRLVRSGLMPTVTPLLSARCEGCDTVTSFAVVDARYATCTVCGVTAEREGLTIVPG